MLGPESPAHYKQIRIGAGPTNFSPEGTWRNQTGFKKTMKEWDVVVSYFYRWSIILFRHVSGNILYHISSDQIRYSLN